MAETQIMHDSQQQNNQYNGVMTVATPGKKRNNFKGQVSGFVPISSVTQAGDTESSLRQLESSPVSEKWGRGGGEQTKKQNKKTSC